MKNLVFLFVVVSFFGLSACSEESSSGAAHNVSMDAGNNFGAVASNISSSPALLKRSLEMRPTIGASLPSDMALDRSKFSNRHIAETHNLSIETIPDDIKGRYDRDFKKCLELGCDIITSNVQSRRSANIYARIAPEQLGVYLDFLGAGAGDLKSHSVSADDKTFEYIDTDAKIKNLIALKQRLLFLLESQTTQKVEDVLKIERELNRVGQKLDSAQNSLRHLQTITGKATVRVTYNVSYMDVEFRYHDLKQSFSEAWQGFVRSLSDVIVFIGSVLPWIPIFVLGLWFFIKAFRFAFKKRNGSWKFWQKFSKRKSEVSEKFTDSKDQDLKADS